MLTIKVLKSKKILQVFQEQTLAFEFPIGIGKNEIGHKKTRSDLRTPEGEYKICVKNDQSKFHLSLGLNYPNLNDAKNGLIAGHITSEEFKSILEAQNTHGGSDWSTPLGGAIYIHGGLEDKNWSEGCVRMFNKDIETIYSLIEKETPVLIAP